MAELKIITMRDVEKEQVEWLWKPYIPLGKISIIQGDPGDGKTTMALAIAAAVTTGTALPGGYAATAPARVIFQTAEDGLCDTIKPRLEQLGADCGRVHIIDEEEAALSLSDERIEAAIVKMDAKLFVLDPLQAYLGGADFHTASGIRPLMRRLSDVAERTGCAVVIIGHLNKKGGKAQYRGLGSVDIFAAARSVLTIGRIPVDENMRAVVHNKSNLSPAGQSVAFGLDPVNGFCWLGDYEIDIDELLRDRKQPADNQFTKARRMLEISLSSGPVLAVDMEQAAEEQGISHRTLCRAKKALGVVSVKRNGKWYWELSIEVEYSVSADEGCQGCQNPPMEHLALMPVAGEV